MEVIPVICRAMAASGIPITLAAIYEALGRGGLARLGRREATGGVAAAGYVGLQKRLGALAACARIFEEKITGIKADRPALTNALDHLRAGDTLVVWRLDRLGRSLSELVHLTTTLEQRGVAFKSLAEQIDTTTSGGKLIFHIFAALAEFERNLIRERTQAGLQAARARGRYGGRPRRLETDKKVTMAQTLYDEKSNSIDEICRIELHGSRRTLAGMTTKERLELYVQSLSEARVSFGNARSVCVPKISRLR